MPYFTSSYQAPGGYFRPGQTVRLKSVVGNYIATLPWFSLDYARSVNSVGNMTLIIPSTVPYSYLVVDNRIEVWRTIDSGKTALDMDTAWLIKSIKLVHGDNGRSSWEIMAEDMKTIIKSRIVAYNQGSNQAIKSATSDNLMKAIMRENFGSSATTGRDISAYLSIQADTSLGLTMVKAFEYRGVEDIFGEIIEASLATASPVYFDIVMTGSNTNTPEFRTYIQQRGIDRRAGRANALILSPSKGNVGAYSITDSYADEATFVYALGPGNLGARMIATSSDTAKIARSPWGRIERVTEGQSTTGTALTHEADAELQLSRSRKVVEGQILQNTSTQYGRDWGFGDQMTFYSSGDFTFNVRVDAVHVSVSAQKESVDGYFRG